MIYRYALVILLVLLLLFSVGYFLKALLYKPVTYSIADKEKKVGVTEKEKEQDAGEMNYRKIVEKNIFHPERKPVEASSPEEVIEPEVPAVMPDIALKGIVQRPDGQFVAYVVIEEGPARPVYAGDRIDDLKVVSITRSDVTMKWRENTIQLSLKKVKTEGVKQ